jgi:hypothetical protein
MEAQFGISAIRQGFSKRIAADQTVRENKVW